MLSVIIGIVICLFGVGIVVFCVRRFQNPEDTKSFQRSQMLAEEYTIPERCRIENIVGGFSPFVEISVLSERNRKYRLYISMKEDMLGRNAVFYRHKDNSSAFIPDYMLYDADAKYIKRKAVVGVLMGVMVICAGVFVLYMF